MKSYKKKRIVVLLVVISVLALMAFTAVKKLRGHGYLSAVKNYIHYLMDRPDFSQYAPMPEDADAWYQKERVIAHALGSAGDAAYTNSREALESSLEKGYHVFEADLAVTSDGKVVCAHDFKDFGEAIPSYGAFMASRIAGQYTPVDMEQLVSVLAQEQEMYLMTDFKWDNSFGSSNQDVETILDTLSACLDAQGDPALYERVIIQVYSEENYHFVADRYPFVNYVYTLYQYAYPIYDDIAAACLENGIPVVTMSYDRATKEHVDLFAQWNIKVFSHTVNDLEEAGRQVGNGVWGIYTDTVLSEELEEIR